MDYKPNSHRAKEQEARQADNQEKRVSKVVAVSAKTRQKSELRKLTDIFVTGDLQNAASYIFTDLVIPAGKKLVYDIVTNGIDILLYGDTARSEKNRNMGHVPYNRFSDRPNERRRYNEPARVKTRFDDEDIVLETRAEAEALLREMRADIDQYGLVTVAAMYDMANLSQPYTSNKYGWTNLTNAYVDRARAGGYVIRLPKAMPID